MREVCNAVMVFRCLTAVGVAAVAGTEEGAEGAACSGGGDGLAAAHIAELRAAAEYIHMAVRDSSTEVARRGSSGVESAGIELLDVGILYLPGDIARIICAVGFADALHGCATDGTEAASVDVAFGVVAMAVGAANVEAGEIEFIVVATCHRYG